MSAIDTINTKVNEAITASEAGDYDTAVKKLHSAKALLATLPSRSAKQGVELEFDATAIDSLIVSFERRLSSSAGIRETKIEYGRPTS